jgi:DNA-binding CsgD family transcriptional regulator
MLRQIAKYIGLFLLLFCGMYCFSQAGRDKSLQEKVIENATLFKGNVDSAFSQLDGLIHQAVSEKDSIQELALLERTCSYFYLKSQPDNLIKASEELLYKATLYNELFALSMASVYMAEAYSINYLYDKALTHLEKAYKILLNDKSNKKRVFLAKANVLNSFANVYLDKGEPEKAVAKLKLVIKDYQILDDISDIMKFQYLNYSNIASAYTYYNLDSAEYFALKSISLKPSGQEDDKIMLTNYYVLGRVNMEKKLFQTAVSHYDKAIQISTKTGEQLYLRGIYTDLVDLYNQTDKKDSVIIYDNKLKELEIQNLQTKYNSLQMIIDKDQQPEKKTYMNVWLFFTLLVIVLAGIFFIIYFTKKKKQQPPLPPQEIYNSLIELVKKNDPGFMFTFEQAYPDFSPFLLQVNPELSKSEIEFCALLKLNLSTKEIAKYKFLEPRTIQNKKHRIRKRLNIKSTTDIYNWISTIQ